ncbi:MAG: response regulator, partial [Nocardioidaceae bacterium]
MSGPTILVVDDHAGFRATARRLLERDGWTVVGEAEDGLAALRAAAALRPDVVLLDIGLPRHDGFWVADRLALDARGPAVVLVSSRDSDAYGDRIATSPALGFLAKSDLDGVRLRAMVAA